MERDWGKVGGRKAGRRSWGGAGWSRGVGRGREVQEAERA